MKLSTFVRGSKLCSEISIIIAHVTSTHSEILAYYVFSKGSEAWTIIKADERD